MAAIRNYSRVNYPQSIVKACSIQPPSLVNLSVGTKPLILWGAIALVLYIIVSMILLPALRPQSLIIAGQLLLSLWQAMFQATQVVLHHYLFALL